MIDDEDFELENYQTPMTARSRLKKPPKHTPGETETVPCQKFEVVTTYTMPPSEKIIYAGFLYDQNPTFVLIISVNEQESSSYLSLGKIVSSLEDSEQTLKRNLTRNLEENPNM